MARIPKADAASLPAELAGLAEDPWYGILAHRPEIVEGWFHLDKVFFGSTSTLPNELKEEARRALAQGAGCRLCASFGQPRDSYPDLRESLAVTFARMVLEDHQAIDDSTMEVMREEFTDEELVELISWICFKLGSNVFGSLMRLDPGTDAQVQAYAEFVADG